MATNVVTIDREKYRKAAGPFALKAFLSGFRVTVGHFVGNLVGWIRGKPTVETVMFPEEHLAKPPAFRGMPVLVEMDNGKERCVACGLCEWACPVNCIHIEPGETTDEVERYPQVFDIEMSRCMYCGLCEEACPEEAIVMSDRIEISAFTRAGTLWTKEDLLTPANQLSRRLEHIRRDYDRR